jgi:hypothetical protein
MLLSCEKDKSTELQVAYGTFGMDSGGMINSQGNTEAPNGSLWLAKAIMSEVSNSFTWNYSCNVYFYGGAPAAGQYALTTSTDSVTAGKAYAEIIMQNAEGEWWRCRSINGTLNVLSGSAHPYRLQFTNADGIYDYDYHNFGASANPSTPRTMSADLIFN